jgi:arylformamidase
MEWIDISVPLRSGMVHWPGDPEVKIERVRDAEKGDRNTLSEVCMGAHTGTHMDAPLHFIRGGAGIDRLPLDLAMGQVRIIEIDDVESIKPRELEKHHISRGERILFKTRNSSHVWQSSSFIENFVFISVEAARFIIERGLSFIGIDYLSVGGYQRDGSEVHKALLAAGIWIIEGLDLSKVSAGQYEMVCLPLRIVDGDGALARAIVRPVV